MNFSLFSVISVLKNSTEALEIIFNTEVTELMEFHKMEHLLQRFF